MGIQYAHGKPHSRGLNNGVQGPYGPWRVQGGALAEREAAPRYTARIAAARRRAASAVRGAGVEAKPTTSPDCLGAPR